MVKVIRESDKGVFSKKGVLLNSEEGVKSLSNPTRASILEIIAERPLYPSKIAEKLGISDQSIYYHIKNLRRNGLIEEVDENPQGSSSVKFFTPTAKVFCVEISNDSGNPYQVVNEGKESVRSYFNPLIKDGLFQGSIVVGSPTPHGPNQVRGLDNHFGIDLAAKLGNFGRINGSTVMLDTEVTEKYVNSASESFVFVGGPLTNMATKWFNKYFPVRFGMKNFPYRKVVSEKTGNTYHEGSVGIICRIRNPKNPEQFIFALAGIRKEGTKAAVMSVTNFSEKVFSSFENEEKHGTVVKGLDMDGDGIVDDVKVLE